MRHPLLLLLPFVLAATRSLSVGVQSFGKPGWLPVLSAEAEYEFLVVVVFCLTGLVGALAFMFRFPELGAVIAEYNQF